MAYAQWLAINARRDQPSSVHLALGVDGDSEIVAHVFDERDPAVKRLIATRIGAARSARRKIGICGQAPSDYPEFSEFVVRERIDSISLNLDVV